MRTLNMVFLLAGAFTGVSAYAQCSVQLPLDTVTIYHGYEPLSCATLTADGSGSAPISFAWSNGSIDATATFCDTASAWHQVVLTDVYGCTAIDSAFVLVVDVRCGNDLKKVSVCHVPPGNPANEHTICIGTAAVEAHLAHGCRLGPCDVVPSEGITMEVSPNPVIDEAIITINSTSTLPVSLSAMDASGKTSVTLHEGVVVADVPMLVALDASAWAGKGRMVWLRLTAGSTIITRKVMVLE